MHNTYKQFDAIAIAHSGVKDLQPYQPGKPIESLKRELGLKNIIKLASNENPLGPSSLALKSINNALSDLNLYPDANGFELKEAIASYDAVSAESVTLGNGSENVVELLIRAFCEPGHEIVVSEYAFIAYSIIAKGLNVKVKQAPANKYSHDFDAMLAAITAKTKVIFVVNPNNPTGTYLSKATIKQFLEAVPSNVLVVLDEAYVDYMQNVPDYASAVGELENFSNLVVTRTFSKAYGLAGLRIGYGLSHPNVARIIDRIRQPFNVNSLSLVAAQAALSDQAHIHNTLKMNQEALYILEKTFTALNLSYVPSYTNFMLVDLMQDSQPIYKMLLKMGLITRPLIPYGLPNHLRISTGTIEQMQKFSNAFSQIMLPKECVNE